MKFAQVEFLSVISSLLLRNRVEAALPPDIYNKIEIEGLGDVDIDICATNRLQMMLEVPLAR